MVDRILEFDKELLAALSTLKDISVYESVAEAESDGKPEYLVVFTNDSIRGEAYNHESIVSVTEDSFFHPFYVAVSARSAAARNRIVSAVRKKVLGNQFADSSAIIETGIMNSYGDSDITLKPVKYTYIMTFQATLDRSDDE